MLVNSLIVQGQNTLAVTAPMKLEPCSSVELRLQLLGDFRVEVGGQLVTTLSSPRLQALLAYLALHRAAPQHRQHTAFLFWPDTNEAQARTNLRKLLHHLHQTLPTVDNYLLMEGQNLGWRPDAPVSIDVMDFESALAAANAAKDDAVRRAALEQAVLLYHGDLLPGCYDDWVRPERDRLRQLATHALHTLVALLEAQRDYRAAIGQAQRLLQLDATDEAAAHTSMRLLALEGDRRWRVARLSRLRHGVGRRTGRPAYAPDAGQSTNVYCRLKTRYRPQQDRQPNPTLLGAARNSTPCKPVGRQPALGARICCPSKA